MRRILEKILIFICLVGLCHFFSETEISQKLNKHLYGTFASTKSKVSHLDDVVVITIDDKSVNMLEKSWPWPRSYHAALIDLLTKADVKAIAYNVLFLEATDSDDELIEAFKKNKRVVLPVLDYTINRYQSDFQKYVTFGHDKLLPDDDGILRSIQLYSPTGNQTLPAFSLALLALVDANKSRAYEEMYYSGENNLRFLFERDILLQFYSFSDVLIGKIPLEDFRNKIVFVGVTLAGVGERFIPIYRDSYHGFSGLEIQAHIFDALRTDFYVKMLSDRLNSGVNLAVLMIVLMVTRTKRFPPVINNLFGIVIILILTGVCYLVFQMTNYWVSIVDSTVVSIIYMFIYSVVAMQYRLKEANKTLEANVELRTQELKETNFSLAQEIQERKSVESSLRNSEHDLRVLLDSLQIGIITINSEGQIVTANRTIFLLLRTTYRKFVGRNIQEVLRYEEAKGNMPIVVDNLINALEKHRGPSIQIEGSIADKYDPIPVAITFSRVTQVEKDKFVCLIRDIREQQRAEKMTQEFVATVSHELRTPITSVKGALELISSGVAGELTPKTKNLLSIAVRNSNRLLTLVNDILDTQRIQLGTLEFNLVPLDLVELVQQAIEVNESYVQTYEAKIESRLPSEPIYVLGDYERLIQVMNNLISNAAKFSNSGGAIIDISVILNEREAVVYVVDYGQGIAEDFKENLFKKFSQADDAKHRSQGTGLGLSITKALVERMRGQIDFYSKKGEGATFFFTLPALTLEEKKRIEEYISKNKGMLEPRSSKGIAASKAMGAIISNESPLDK